MKSEQTPFVEKTDRSEGGSEQGEFTRPESTGKRTLAEVFQRSAEKQLGVEQVWNME